jgi:hypothetical protein
MSRSGRTTGGVLISRGHLYWILSNPIYVGRLRHKGQVHDGLHPAIVDIETWDRVRQHLKSQTQTRRTSCPDDQSFLASKLYDDRGNRMAPAMRLRGDGAGAIMCHARHCRDASKRLDRSSAFRRQRSITRLPTQSGLISRRGQTRSTAVTSTTAADVATARSRGMNLAACEGTYRARTMCETRSTAPRSAPRGSRLFWLSRSSSTGRIGS